MSKKVENNVKKGAEFVEGAIDELANTGWNLFKFWLKFMMWFIIIGVAFVLLEGASMNGSLNSDTIILLGGGGAFVYGISLENQKDKRSHFYDLEGHTLLNNYFLDIRNLSALAKI